jgi:hypothetical protein
MDFCESIPISARTERMVDQLSGAATSVAANYRAARLPAAAQELHAEALELTKIFARSAGTARKRHRK